MKYTVVVIYFIVCGVLKKRDKFCQCKHYFDCSRPHYVRKLKAIDTGERDRALRELVRPMSLKLSDYLSLISFFLSATTNRYFFFLLVKESNHRCLFLKLLVSTVLKSFRIHLVAFGPRRGCYIH